MSPATSRCRSTASRAISRCMISVEPSKIRLMRMSRMHLLHRHGLLAARLQRLGRLVAASAADLHELVGDLSSPARRRTAWRSPPRCGCRSLVVGEAARDVEHRLEAERGRGDEGDLLRHRLVLAHRLAPLHPLERDHSRATLVAHFADADADRRQRQPPRVERGQRDLQPVALAPDQVLARDEDVVEQRHRVLDPAQAHELVAVLDHHAVAVVGEHEAVMPPRWPSLLGTLAMTTTTSAIAPLVAHSLRPFST